MNASTDFARADLAAASSLAGFDSLFGLPDDVPHERVLLTSDPASGLKTVIALHSTARGPAFGGCRLWRYADDASALHDALRLAQGMSLKNALADLPFGGGKAVILKPSGDFDREELFASFGRAVDSMNGSYITAEDVGSTTADMQSVRRQTPFVSGITREGGFGGDPSPFTALGVFTAIEAGVRLHLRRSSLDGLRVAIQGLGAVGMQLAALLHGAGARLTVADVAAPRVTEACDRFGAQAMATSEILAAEVDVLAPCALGAALNSLTVRHVRARMICGAANNQLANLTDGDVLHERDVLLLPDFLVNAGGIIAVAREYLGQGELASVNAEIGRIGGRVAELLDRCEAQRCPPARVAQAWAREKLARAA